MSVLFRTSGADGIFWVGVAVRRPDRRFTHRLTRRGRAYNGGHGLGRHGDTTRRADQIVNDFELVKVSFLTGFVGVHGEPEPLFTIVNLICPATDFPANRPLDTLPVMLAVVGADFDVVALSTTVEVLPFFHLMLPFNGNVVPLARP